MIARTARWLIRNPELKVRSTYNHRSRIALAFLACHRSTLFRWQAREIHRFPLQVQEPKSTGSHSSLRSMTEISRLRLVNRRPLFCTPYMKSKNLTGSKQMNISFPFHSIIIIFKKKNLPFHWEGLNVTQERTFWFYQQTTNRRFDAHSLPNHGNRLNSLRSWGCGLHHKLPTTHTTGPSWPRHVMEGEVDSLKPWEPNCHRQQLSPQKHKVKLASDKDPHTHCRPRGHLRSSRTAFIFLNDTVKRAWR